jgi:hypothetical protein
MVEGAYNTVKNIVTGLIKAFPGNSSVNTVQYATMEAVFVCRPSRAAVEERGCATRFLATAR